MELIKQYTFMCYLLLLVSIEMATAMEEPQCLSRFDFDYKVLQKLLALETELGQLKITVADQRRIIDLQSDMNKLGQNHLALEKKLEQLNITVADQRRIIDSQSLLQADLEKAFALKNRSVAFLAKVTPKSLSLRNGQKIVFETEMINLGEFYNKSDGVFTAPSAGVYMFSTSVMSNPDTGGNRVEVSIVKNGLAYAGALAAGTQIYDQGSVSVVMQLNARDEVWVKHNYPLEGALWGKSFSTFMGVLIQAL